MSAPVLSGDAWSELAREEYEMGLIEEARRLVAGELPGVPSLEHLRVLLAWLDGALPLAPFNPEEQPF